MGAFALLFVDLVDELGAGLPVTEAPGVRDELGLGYGDLSWMLLAGPLLLSMILEPPLLALSDRWPRRPMVVVGLLLMAASLAATALTTSVWIFVLGFASWCAAGGVGVGVAQASLMAAFPEQRERMMTRWTLMGATGDALAPVLVLGVGALGAGWRTSLWVAAALHLLTAVWVAVTPDPGGPSPAGACDEDEVPEVGTWEALRRGIRCRPLLRWLGAAALCCLLDEILVAFGTLFLRDEVGASLTERSAVVFADAIGCAVGLLVTERLLAHVQARRILVLSGLGCAAMYVAWLCTPWPWLSAVLMFLVGLFCAPLYPLSQARAYAALPEHPGVVRAVDNIFLPLPILAPLAVGWLADHVGITTALTLLLLQPLGVTLLSLGEGRSGGSGSDASRRKDFVPGSTRPERHRL